MTQQHLNDLFRLDLGQVYLALLWPIEEAIRILERPREPNPWQDEGGEA